MSSKSRAGTIVQSGFHLIDNVEVATDCLLCAYHHDVMWWYAHNKCALKYASFLFSSSRKEVKLLDSFCLSLSHSQNSPEFLSTLSKKKNGASFSVLTAAHNFPSKLQEQQGLSLHQWRSKLYLTRLLQSPQPQVHENWIGFFFFFWLKIIYDCAYNNNNNNTVVEDYLRWEWRWRRSRRRKDLVRFVMLRLSLLVICSSSPLFLPCEPLHSILFHNFISLSLSLSLSLYNI